MSCAGRPTALRRKAPGPVQEGRLLVATDGLLKYASRATISALARTGDVQTAVEALMQAVTLPSGNLQDDVAVVLGEHVGEPAAAADAACGAAERQAVSEQQR
ncbi:hypothetical protein [Sorangium sp. So ce406]|uniref:hypothetical protein n=1 Tax=Sorangium sp. So ce406 TaxID=3133311 RepID=UPI003F5C765D